jgi:SAM-dependent methyltransferase
VTTRFAGSVHVPTGNAYDKYGSGNPVERRLMAGFFARLDAVVPSDPPTSVLEVGVGEGSVTGRLARRWPRAQFVGVDLPDPMLPTHWCGAAFAAVFGDICALPFPNRCFDLVLAIETLEHVYNPGIALRELGRVSRGLLVLSVPREPVWRMANLARGKYVSDAGNTPGHVNHWSSRAFADLVSCELTVHKVYRPFPWTMVTASARR